MRISCAKFEKVSFEQFKKDVKKTLNLVEDDVIREMYDNVKIPTRATAGSAGYDFVTPIELTLSAGRTALIPSGIRVKMDPNWVLIMAPRSGQGFKYRIQLDNTIGVIDSDYYGSDNEGHIMIKLTNDSKTDSLDKILHVDAGNAVCQGIFLPFGVTEDDNAVAIRNGGFGSTSC